MTDDAQLLRRYVEERSEPAFADIVQRHLGLVYHSALRQLSGNAHLAEDVAQGVFILLAEKSRSLLTHPSLAAWLHASTRFKVSEVLRAERRRRTREAAAHFMHELMQDDPSAKDWERLRPMIDEVLLELKDSDREAVLLRFFEGRSFADIAAQLRLTENTAHKRVERALENLRERLGRRGVKSTASALASALGAPAALAAPPAGLAAAVTGTVLASTVPAAAVSSLMVFMSTKTTVAVAVIIAAVTGGVATHQLSVERDARAGVATIEQENAALAVRVQAEESRRTRAASPKSAAVFTTPSTSAPTSAVARNLGSGGLATIEESNAFLAANPDVREALVVATRAQVAEEYTELFPTLGLTDAEREQFLAILASGYRRIVGEHQFSIGGEMVSGAEITRQLRELLGEARYQRYREFRSTAVERDLTREMTRSLYFTPTPLSAEQTTTLKDIVSRVMVDPSLGPKYTGNVWPYIPLNRWERLVAEAATVLSEPQVDALRELQQQSQFFHAQTAASHAWRARQSNKEGGK